MARRAAQAPPTDTASGQQKQGATPVAEQRRHVSVTPQVRRLSPVFRGACGQMRQNRRTPDSSPTGARDGMKHDDDMVSSRAASQVTQTRRQGS
ncbi:predicted protein [Pyrenophora tritici-repentis Pt-1C-BFP]|uniref:Uncharacterized protein n=1 Tax=Pyrenophora tritici-repentis (strain Pt-1C-BFP) TaxID=426418 RepID=B2WC84_PYRTR|nr:uncharacterized protein PTRG_07593 [Pyrenophora tritici-repentis Pt-1C-BFP]EDU50512.1 predicted protein [Pyrenophora tritici-repentis Pt-1C-BFP]